jgi:hypothetical protein
MGYPHQASNFDNYLSNFRGIRGHYFPDYGNAFICDFNYKEIEIPTGYIFEYLGE